MLSTKKIILLAILFMIAILPLGCAEPTDQEDISEEEEVPIQEEEPEEEIEEPDIDEIEEEAEEEDYQQADDEPASQPVPSSTFEHQVDMKINGTVERDKGEEWWKMED